MVRSLLILGSVAIALGGCAASEVGDDAAASEAAFSSRSRSHMPGLALSVHTTLGIPEAATVDDPKHALLVKPQYVTSYDSERKNPRWTSWELTAAWLGSAARTSSFTTDDDLPAGIPQATNHDFTNSGYQRGHICPSADRTRSPSENASTFVFTNAVPQTQQSNVGPWESLERDERAFAQAGSHLFIVAGSIYASDRTIGDGVAVPTSMFKVVVVTEGAHPLPTDVTTSTRVIAIEVPNTTSVSGSYESYRTRFEDLEAKTGLHLLSDVPAAVHDALAARIDTL